MQGGCSRTLLAKIDNIVDIDEYPSGADIERERNYRKRKLKEQAETLESQNIDNALCDGFDYDFDEDLDQYLTDEELEEEKELLLEAKAARQIFLPDDREYPDRVVFSCKRAPRVKSLHLDKSLWILMGENHYLQSVIEGFVNDDQKCVRQYFPFSYPADYHNAQMTYLRHKVKANGCPSNGRYADWCEVLYYNPFSFYDDPDDLFSNSGDSVDFRHINIGKVLRDSIQEALNDMEPEASDYVDIIMDIPEWAEKHAISYIVDVLAHFKENYPHIKVRVSVNVVKAIYDFRICELGWRYLLFEKDTYLQSL